MSSSLEIHYMREALKEARKAFEKDEVPVGAVIVNDGKIIAQHIIRWSCLKTPLPTPR